MQRTRVCLVVAASTGRSIAQPARNCWRSAARSAAARPEYAIRTIAFPSISTGAYGYPIEQAALVAIDEVDRFLAENGHFERVTFVCFGQAAFEVYVDTARGMLE